jgi:hypothetical protein
MNENRASESGMAQAARRVFMVLSPRSLGYARYALESLFRNAAERIHLHLITDSAQDKAVLTEELALRQQTAHHLWTIYSEGDLADADAVQFHGFSNLQRFRKGHPCWRKITDPILLSSPAQEMVLLDPDIYFPNRFLFESTPPEGLLLMWQRPTCLYPPETVRTAMAASIRLAHHVDIGVAHLRAPVDLDWLDWLIGRLNCFHRREMHIEAIVWAALAMRIGGGYLDPHYWHCWRRSQQARVLGKLGVSGPTLLRSEPFSSIKCFHAGGPAKSWLAEAKLKGVLDTGKTVTNPGRIRPFVEITPKSYEREQRIKELLATLGYYSLFSTT